MATKHKAPPPDPPQLTTESGEGLETVGTVEIPSTAPDFGADEAELGQEPSAFRWHLSRALFRGGKREWEICTSYPAGVGALTADVIREEWGPGVYLAQLRGGPGTGSGAVRKSRLFHLATPRGFVPGAPSPSTTPTSDLSAVLGKLLEQQQRGFEQLSQALTSRPAGGADPAAMLDLAMRMAERMTPKRGESEDTLERVGRWFDLADRFRSGKDWTDLISEGISTVRPLVDVAVSRLGGPSPEPTPNTASAVAVNGNGAAPQVVQPPMLQLANFLQRQVRYLTGKAKAKASPNLYAEVVLDNLPAGIEFSQVLEVIKRPGALDQLFGMLSSDDRIAAQSERAWFEELLREMTAFLEEQLEPAAGGEDDSGGKVGDTPAA